MSRAVVAKAMCIPDTLSRPTQGLLFSLLVLEWLGRRATGALSYLLTGVFTIGLGMSHSAEERPWLVVAACAYVARASANAANNGTLCV